MQPHLISKALRKPWRVPGCPAVGPFPWSSLRCTFRTPDSHQAQVKHAQVWSLLDEMRWLIVLWDMR